MPSPFEQEDLNELLVEMLQSQELQQWRQNGLNFGKFADIYSMPERAADEIVKVLG